jgi:ParB family chromosome partitioning protein
MSKKRLGRGLDALLSSSRPQPVESAEIPNAEFGEQPAVTPMGVATLLIADVQSSPYQPRRYFDEEALADLGQSIKHSGLLQPIVVREKAQGGFQLIAGERRLRAAALIGLERIPALVRAVSDEEASALALIENMQREDLGALEEAQGLARLRDEFELTQQQIADAVGKSRVAIANLLRLLNLGTPAKDMLAAGDLEMGHARALLGLSGVEQERAALQVVENGLSVRQTEELVRRLLGGPKEVVPKTVRNDSDTQRLEQSLTDHLGAPVNIKQSVKGGGEMVIKYSTLEELDGVLEHFGFKNTDS